ncbi:MAG: acyl-ACP--UDP-N-acetylglucosamine O-acyltransferase [Gammaproteobacteria bacterium]|nr:MAG: acyl-ACP--UDP-N-acetylglucosamine O-acyltransferase [Gammaproteobacteria bacterium]
MIHPTAVVEAGAQIAPDVEIGPYCVIGAEVEIDSGTKIGPHVVIHGRTRIGQRNQIYQFASIGEANQDKKYQGEPTETIIGNDNVIREFVTIHRGTVQDRGVTRIGDDNLLMAYVHVAHDCVIGNHCILANNATLAGHVHLDDWVILGGFTGIHQFCRIGAHAFTSISASILKDVPPYVMADGQPAKPRGLNTEGLRRRGFSADDIQVIKRAYKLLYRSQLPLQEALEQIVQMKSPLTEPLVTFIRESQRGIIR